MYNSKNETNACDFRKRLQTIIESMEETEKEFEKLGEEIREFKEQFFNE